LESVFLEHSYRWLKAGGVLIFVIPQLRLAKCARLPSEHFSDLRVFRLIEPACLEYKQIVVVATRRKRHTKVSDAVLFGWSAPPRSAGNEERA
jgi:tRNA1(Val) A37 N6-methylase TrmN6